MKRYFLFLIVSLILMIYPNGTMKSDSTDRQKTAVVVLASPDDDFYPLAIDIAREEAAPLANTWAEALAKNPDVVLWVVSPSRITDRVMAAAGMALEQHAEMPAVGILSGTTQADARQLWMRGKQRSASTQHNPVDRFYAANGEYPTAGIFQAQLIAFQSGQRQKTPLDPASLANALERADYLTFTGHGGDSYLRLDPQTKFSAGDLPDLPLVVVATASCQTLRPWTEDSIALGFIQKGAAAYAGFVYSPLEGYLIGQFEELPFRYTWPEFTIGNVIALQNRGALQGFASFPHYFVLGDPSIALDSAPPYEIAQDVENKGIRTLVIRGAPQGLIPITIPDGGRYKYVDVPGLADTTDGDPFFNSRIQAASLNGDKYIILTHPGGDFTLRLQESPPWHWWLTRPLLASFDHVALFTPLNSGDWIMIAAGIVSLLIAAVRWWKLRKDRQQPFRRFALVSIGAGLCAALLLGLYQVLRLPHASITTKPLALNPLWLVGVALIHASGTWLFLFARTWTGKLLSFIVIVLPALLPAVFVFLAIGITNLLYSQAVGTPIYNYHLASLPLIAAGLWMVCLWAALAKFRHLPVG